MLSDAMILRVAHCAYEVVRIWEEENDRLIEPWEELSEAARDDVILRVTRVQTEGRMGDATFHLEWVAQQIKDGWTYSKVYDETRKTSPLLTPFHQLPSDLQAKERVFRTTVLALSRV